LAREIVVRMSFRIVRSRGHTRAHWVRGAVDARKPLLGQAHREHEDVELLEQLADSGEVLLAIRPVLLLARKPARLDVGSERIEVSALAVSPHVLSWVERLVRPIEQLHELPRCIEIPVSRRERAVVEFGGKRAEKRMPGLGDEVVEAALREMAGQTDG